MKCKCGKTVCIIHRYPDDHNCDYDSKNEMKKKLILMLENLKNFILLRIFIKIIMKYIF